MGGGPPTPPPTRINRGDGIVVVVHTGVAAAQLCAAVGRDFDFAHATQKTSHFMESLGDRIGLDPEGDFWKREVVNLVKDDWVQRGTLTSMEDPQYEQMLDGEDSWARSFQAFCEKPDYKRSIEATLEQTQKYFRSNCTVSLEDARLLTIFRGYGDVLAAATREARPDYAGLTHRLYNLLARLAHGAGIAPDCYKHLEHTTAERGEGCGLEDTDPEWKAVVRSAVKAASQAALEGADFSQNARNGFSLHGGHYSLTSAGATIVMPEQPMILAPEGFRQPHFRNEMAAQDSVVVKFVSAGRDDAGLHTAVLTDSANAIFPPMTLFTATDVHLGSFEFDGTAGLLRGSHPDK